MSASARPPVRTETTTSAKGKGRAVDPGPIRDSTVSSAFEPSYSTRPDAMIGGWGARESAMSSASAAQPFAYERYALADRESVASAYAHPSAMDAADAGSPTRQRASLGAGVPRNFSRPMRLNQAAEGEPSSPPSELGYSFGSSSSPPPRGVGTSSPPTASSSWTTPRAVEPIREGVPSYYYGSPSSPPRDAVMSDAEQRAAEKRERHKSNSSIGTTKSDRSSKWRFFGRRERRADSVEEHDEGPAPAPTITLSLDGHQPEPLGLGEADFERAKARGDAERAARETEERRRRHEAQQRLAAASSMSPRLTADPMERLADQPTRSRSASASSKGSQLSRTTSVASDLSLYSLGGGVDTSSEGHLALSENGHTPLPGPSGLGPPDRTITKAKRSLDMLKVPSASGATKSATAGSGHGREPTALSPNDPNDCLQLGIECHERGELARSAYFFERSAKEKGGVGAGMLMWGLTLRHGWGVAVNEQLGFAFLQRAAETVVEDLDTVVRSGGEHGFADDQARLAAAAKSELVLSIFELGQSFAKGWGVKKDKRMALSYFQLAAGLGDADAQQECGFRYLHGKGCKKDRRQAAHYYRMAAKQGVKSFGMSWIDAPKYLSDPE